MKKSHIATLLIFLLVIPATLYFGLRLTGRAYYLTSTLVIIEIIIPFLLAFATALTALYGFPPNAIITENTCNALAETPEEKEYLMSKMFPPMIVGGFTTVTITSVVIAGIFAEMF